MELTATGGYKPPKPPLGIVANEPIKSIPRYIPTKEQLNPFPLESEPKPNMYIKNPLQPVVKGDITNGIVKPLKSTEEQAKIEQQAKDVTTSAKASVKSTVLKWALPVIVVLVVGLLAKKLFTNPKTKKLK